MGFNSMFKELRGVCIEICVLHNGLEILLMVIPQRGHNISQLERPISNGFIGKLWLLLLKLSGSRQYFAKRIQNFR